MVALQLELQTSAAQSQQRRGVRDVALSLCQGLLNCGLLQFRDPVRQRARHQRRAIVPRVPIGVLGWAQAGGQIGGANYGSSG